jgi:putative intracellular protease/amidase
MCEPGKLRQLGFGLKSSMQDRGTAEQDADMLCRNAQNSSRSAIPQVLHSPRAGCKLPGMTRVAYLLTSATEMTLADGSAYPTGYFAHEAIEPYDRFMVAGFEVVVITPDGRPPHADPYGLSWFFHYPDADSDFLASVVRTFARDVDDIRLTLHQSTDLGLIAARRIAALLAPGDAHAIVSAAARRAWRDDRQFVDALLEDEGVTLTRDALEREVAVQRADSELLAAERFERLQALPAPLALSDIDPADFDAVFAPGGRGPMVDMAENDDVGRLLAALQKRGAPIAALCHGPAMLLAAPEREDGLWLFDGYRMTCITDDEELQTEAGRLGPAWFLDTALKNAGAVFDDGPAAWASHVVVDRNLITGQNPRSTQATADAFVRMLTRPSIAVA